MIQLLSTQQLCFATRFGLPSLFSLFRTALEAAKAEAAAEAAESTQLSPLLLQYLFFTFSF